MFNVKVVERDRLKKKRHILHAYTIKLLLEQTKIFDTDAICFVYEKTQIFSERKNSFSSKHLQMLFCIIRMQPMQI